LQASLREALASFHVAQLEATIPSEASRACAIRHPDQTLGFCIQERDFNYMKPGEELVVEPFQRLIAEKKIIGYPRPFWCMDTFKEHQN